MTFFDSDSFPDIAIREFFYTRREAQVLPNVSPSRAVVEFKLKGLS